MRVNSLIYILIIAAIFAAPYSYGQKGFSIEAGLLHDQPNHTAHDRPYDNMKGGYGYIANIGYDFFDRIGLETGVMHSGHDYDLIIIGDDIREATAEKTAFYVKLRGIPVKWKKAELVAGLGIGFYDISGQRIFESSGITFAADESFSGVGVLGNVSLRYHFSGGLAVGFYLGANFVNYDRYSLVVYPPQQFTGSLPGGDSINLGITIFHRIGIPQI